MQRSQPNLRARSPKLSNRRPLHEGCSLCVNKVFVDGWPVSNSLSQGFLSSRQILTCESNSSGFIRSLNRRETLVQLALEKSCHVGSVTGIRNYLEIADPLVILARNHSFRSLGGPALASESNGNQAKRSRGVCLAEQSATILPTQLTKVTCGHPSCLCSCFR